MVVVSDNIPLIHSQGKSEWVDRPIEREGEMGFRRSGII